MEPERPPSRHPPTRRQFITGDAAVSAVQDAAARAALRDAQAAGLFEVAAAGEAPYLVRFGREAMAADFQLFTIAGEDDAASALAALDRIDEIETQLTVYRDTSEVLEINRRAAAGPVEVEPRLFALLERAVHWFHETGGAYDVTSGPLSRAWGFARRSGTVPSDDDLEAARRLVGSEKLLLDPAARTVQFTLPGVEINCNSVGKGYALDRAAELLAEHGQANFLWHGGRSSVLARGTSRPGSSGPAVGWSIGVGHPLRLERRLAEIMLFDEAAGTSGAGYQFFRHEGKRYGHILDPRSGRPAEGVFSVTVIAPTAAEADALSTAFYVMGFEAAADYCAQRPEIGFLMLLPTAGGAVELATVNLDERRWRLVT